jgi:hypothetical protein
VGGVAGRVDETWVDEVWDGAAGFASGDCASSDAERARPATAANRIGEKLCMWLVGRATAAEVTRREDALLRSVYRESRVLDRTLEVWLIQGVLWVQDEARGVCQGFPPDS